MKRVATEDTAGAVAVKRGCTSMVMSQNDEILFLDLFLVPDGIFSQLERFLGWRDVVNLVAVNRDFRRQYKGRQDAVLETLLSYLDVLVGTNIHSDCGEFYAPLSRRKCQCHLNEEESESYIIHPEHQIGPGLDPRYETEYDELPVSKKCIALIEYLTFVVQNLKSEFDFSDLANPSKLPECISLGNEDPISSWSLGHDFIVENAWKDAFPRRSTFAFNLALMSLALGELESDPHYCSKAVLGTGKIEYGGSFFGTSITEMVHYLLPLRDQDLVDFIRDDLYPKRELLNFLGPVLVPKVVLWYPLFEMVSPCRTGLEGVTLPSELEVIANEDLDEFYNDIRVQDARP